ncbi:hypothetical protein [Janibacter sp. GXQ6167]|uniref:hypothetical protein n=1 Tax=Janibacter sp. GXQ6167 TaxID=3240791 RepID=UPI0035264DCA
MSSDDRRSEQPEGVEALEDLFGSRGEPSTHQAPPNAAPTRPIPPLPVSENADDDTAPQPVVRATPPPPVVPPASPSPAYPPPASAGAQGPAAGTRSAAPRAGGAGLSPFALVAMLVGAVLVGALIMGLFQIMGSDNQSAAPATTTVTTTPEPTTTGEPTPTTPSSTSTSPSKSSTSSTGVKRSGTKPAAVKKVCAGSWRGTRVGVGTTSTTCGFAVRVRKAYIEGGGDGSAITVRAKSPATGKVYRMSCSGAAVTRCTGGNNAVVYLY